MFRKIGTCFVERVRVSVVVSTTYQPTALYIISPPARTEGLLIVQFKQPTLVRHMPRHTLLVMPYRQLPASATTPLSRGLRRRRCWEESGTPISALPSTTTTPHQHWRQYQDQRRKQLLLPPTPAPVTPVGIVESWDRGFNGGKGAWASGCDLVGLEEELARRNGADEERDEKRERMETTRRAVCEALALWSSKADLLQVGVGVCQADLTTQKGRTHTV